MTKSESLKLSAKHRKETGKRIIKLMQKQGLDRTKLAAEIGKSYTAARDYCLGRFSTDMETYRKIADVLGVTVDYLLYGDDKAENDLSKNNDDETETLKAELELLKSLNKQLAEENTSLRLQNMQLKDGFELEIITEGSFTEVIDGKEWDVETLVLRLGCAELKELDDIRKLPPMRYKEKVAAFKRKIAEQLCYDCDEFGTDKTFYLCKNIQNIFTAVVKTKKEDNDE